VTHRVTTYLNIVSRMVKEMGENGHSGLVYGFCQMKPVVSRGLLGG
jgi:hypothetical protein